MSEVEGLIPEVPEELLSEPGVSGWLVVGGTLLGLAIGAGVSYLVTERRLRLKYQERAEDEIEQMREHFRNQLIARDKKPDAEELAKRVAELRYASEAEIKDAEPGPGDLNVQKPDEVSNVFQRQLRDRLDTEKPADDGWDYEVEVASRTPERPYIIHVDEREDEEVEVYEEITLTYYELDDVICDHEDKVVEDRYMVIGDEIVLTKFGHGSRDKNIVYIRNDRLGIVIELIKSENSYAEEVHGFRHSEPQSPRPRRRGVDDDD